MWGVIKEGIDILYPSKNVAIWYNLNQHTMEFSSAIRFESILNKFDKIISKRSCNGDNEYSYPKHSEHGWYLSGDD